MFMYVIKWKIFPFHHIPISFVAFCICKMAPCASIFNYQGGEERGGEKFNGEESISFRYVLCLVGEKYFLFYFFGFHERKYYT